MKNLNTISAAYNDLKLNQTPAKTMAYYLLYSNEPYSVIIDNARYIYSEPYKGTDFFSGVIDSFLRLDYIEPILKELSALIVEHMNDFTIVQKRQFMRLQSKVTAYYNNTMNTRRVLEIYPISDNDVKESVSSLYDVAYQLTKSHSTTETLIDSFNNIIELNTEAALIPHVVYLAVSISDSRVNTVFLNYLKLWNGDGVKAKASSARNSATIKNVLERMLQDTYIKNLVANANPEIRDYIFNIVRRTTDMIVESYLVEQLDTEIFTTTLESAVESVIMEEILNEGNEDYLNNKKLENLIRQREIYDEEMKFLMQDFLATDEDIFDEALVQAKADMLATESAYILFAEAMERVNDINDEILVLEYTADGSKSEVVKSETGEKTKEAIEKEKKIQAKAKRLQEKRKADELKRRKPNPGVVGKVQNAAIDAKIALKGKVAGGSKAVQGIKNAATAVGEVPKTISDEISRNVKKWDDYDDEKKKKYILEPGFRKKYFRLFKLALTHYIAFLINPLLNIVVFICTKLSKEKSARIRNELSQELTAEIKICDMKIEDANSKGNNEAKYKLQRIKTKLEAEKMRIDTNSQYL